MGIIIELFVNFAKSENADIVAGDYNMFDTREEKTYCDCRIEHALTGEEYLLFIMTQGLFNVWGKLGSLIDINVAKLHA